MPVQLWKTEPIVRIKFNTIILIIAVLVNKCSNLMDTMSDDRFDSNFILTKTKVNQCWQHINAVFMFRWLIWTIYYVGSAAIINGNSLQLSERQWNHQSKHNSIWQWQMFFWCSFIQTSNQWNPKEKRQIHQNTDVITVISLFNQHWPLTIPINWFEHFNDKTYRRILQDDTDKIDSIIHCDCKLYNVGRMGEWIWK